MTFQDSDVPVTGELSDCEIIEDVLERKRPRQEEEATEDDDDLELLPVMLSSTELMSRLQNIRVFSEMTGMTSQTKFKTICTELCFIYEEAAHH